MTNKILVVLAIKETLFVSIVRDTYSFLTLTGIVGLGVYWSSWVLQLIGGIAWVGFVFSRALNLSKKYSYTIDEARIKLDEWENE